MEKYLLSRKDFYTSLSIIPWKVDVFDWTEKYLLTSKNVYLCTGIFDFLDFCL